MSLTFSEMESFLLSRGYRKHPKGRSEYSIAMYQRRARTSDDPNRDDLFFNFDLFSASDTGTQTLTGWVQIRREFWTIDVDTFSFFASEIDTLLDGIEVEWFAIADLKTGGE